LVAVWLGTVATFAFTLWDGFTASVVGYETKYSPMVALTAVMVIGLIWYTYFTRQTLEHTRQSQRDATDRLRRSLCTAVLAELRDLSARLMKLHAYGVSAGTVDFFSHPMVQLGSGNPAVMQPETIQALAETSRRLSDIQEFLRRDEELARLPSGVSLTTVQSAQIEKADIDRLIKFRAAWAFNSIARLVKLLRLEGGKMPTKVNEEPVQTLDEIELLPDPFVDFS
jgi:hypothetical protein